MSVPPDGSGGDRPVEELQALIGSARPGFAKRVHRSIDRRVLARDLSVMTWELPKLVLGEVVFICAEWVSGRRGGRGGRS